MYHETASVIAALFSTAPSCRSSARRRSVRRVPSWVRVAALVIALLHALAGTAQAFDRSVFDSLDYGIYWYQDQSMSHKATHGQANPYFVNGQPTLVYIHGWQKDKTPLLYRETFDRSVDAGPAQDLTLAWRAAGWNMGIFYWNQFSDEGDVNDAEAKVWSIDGPRRMRWRKSDGSYVDSGISQTAAQLFVQEYRAALAGYSGHDIRLVGHSLGSQMVIVAAKLISDAVDRGELPENLRPTRVALLDPAFLGGQRPYLNNRQTVDVAADYVAALKSRGVIFETLGTSSASAGSLPVMNRTAYRELKPWYFWSLDLVGKHMAAVWHYLWEYAYPPGLIVGASVVAASASASNEATRLLMGSPQKMQHDQGVWTKTPADDTYKWVSK